jgi:hypothetical protein
MKLQLLLAREFGIRPEERLDGIPLQLPEIK